MSNINVLVLTGYGLNCDYETAYAFGLAGASAQRVHINSLIDGSVNPDDFQIMAFIGGFGWGDDHGAGVIQAARMKTNIGDKLLKFIGKGKLIIGICNGFQALVNLGLLPGINGNYQTRSVALTYNDCGKFRNDWVKLKVNPNSPCIFTKGLENIELPIRHGEGKFYADESVLQHLTGHHQVVLQYAADDSTPANGKFPFNPNGSLYDIAGICDPTGRIFGLMPHPEAFNHYTNHPNWTRDKEFLKRQENAKLPTQTSGIRMFRNAVAYMRATD